MPTVVIVDDDADFRVVARELLASCGVTVLAEAADGSGARAACAAHAPDGVLLDVNLPDASGHELARALRARHPRLRILLTSTEPTAGGVDDVPFVPKLELALCDLGRYFSK